MPKDNTPRISAADIKSGKIQAAKAPNPEAHGGVRGRPVPPPAETFEVIIPGRIEARYVVPEKKRAKVLAYLKGQSRDMYAVRTEIER